ncbi:MAG: hypothetical protein LBN36_02915 [Clostridiales Family XIII bacterium]|jgi:shikimate dehydrogenase|nr:hypothetical protein [Clostridiales Family XIII bacterium]
MKTILLIGMPGCGKTSYGKRAARELDFEFIDSDCLIEESEGMSIADIFRISGEPYFRDLETKTLELILKETKRSKDGRGLIVSLGGGIVEREENVRIMRDTGLVILIDRDPDQIIGDVKFGDKRPLLSEPAKLWELYDRRIALYRNAAHRILKNEGDYMNTLELLMTNICLEGIAGRFAVIGDPIAHSFSPALHKAIFQKIGIADTYRAVRVKAQNLAAATTALRAGDAAGINVTIPHKFRIAAYLDDVKGDAKISGAVNTVVHKDGMLIGYNTDMEGLKQALRRHGRSYTGSNVTVLGAGGAASGIVHKAAADGAKRISILCRTPEKGAEIAASARTVFRRAENDASCPEPEIAVVECDLSVVDPGIAQGIGSVGGENASEILRYTDLLINATPLGMHGVNAKFAGVDFVNLISRDAFVCDLIYNPSETALLAAAARRNMDRCNGLEMLIFQGILADELFLGITTDRNELFAYVIDQFM